MPPNHHHNLDAATPIQSTTLSIEDNSSTHAAAGARNLDAAIPVRSAETELQSTLELRGGGQKKLQLQNRISTAKQ